MAKRIVFLYTELAGYITSCFDRLIEEGVEVHVFHYPVNPEAPFEFDLKSSSCNYHLRSDFSNSELQQEIKRINPGAIVCSGWIDKGYVAICRALKGKFKCVLALDNQLQKGIKARLAFIRAKLFFKSVFKDAWVPGAPQLKYALKLGFQENEIYQGFYTVDVKRWNALEWNTPEGTFPHRFVYVGRYVEFKGIKELWEAYRRLDSKDWELYCAGSGELYEDRALFEGIFHEGFVQPADLDKFVADGGVFILPSHKEPWGVVLHEFAAAGYPLICSENVGAASAFLKNGENGFQVKPNEVLLLQEVMQNIIDTSDDQLFKMGQKSKEIASQVNIEMWLQTALNFLETKNE